MLDGTRKGSTWSDGYLIGDDIIPFCLSDIGPPTRLWRYGLAFTRTFHPVRGRSVSFHLTETRHESSIHQYASSFVAFPAGAVSPVPPLYRFTLRFSVHLTQG